MNFFYEYLAHTPSFDKIVKINYSGCWATNFYDTMGEDIDASIYWGVTFGFGRLDIKARKEYFYCKDINYEYHSYSGDSEMETWERYIREEEFFKGSQLPEVELKTPKHFKMFQGNKWLNITLEGFGDDEILPFLEGFLSDDFEGETIKFKNIITLEEFQIEVPYLD